MHLPILIPGRAEPVNVPFALEPGFSFTVDVFLPKGGVQSVSAWLTTRDLTTAEIAKVDGRRVDLADDEQQRADEAAVDVLAAVLMRLQVGGRVPDDTSGTHTLHAIARAYLAEVAAYEAQREAMKALPMPCRSPVLMPSDPTATTGHWRPNAVSHAMLETYVGWCFEEAQRTQADKAQRQAEEWARHHAEP